MKKSGPLHLLGSLLVLAIFVGAVWLLASELRNHHMSYAKVRDSLFQIRAWHIVAALGLTVVNYAVILVGYDYLAFRYAKVPISLARVAFAALTSYPVSYNLGATLFGAPLRYRLYSSWGIPLTKIVQLLVILALTFWFGVFFISGVLFVLAPLHVSKDELGFLVTDWHISKHVVHAFANSTWLGIGLLAVTGLYVGTSLLHRGSLKIFRWTLPVPPFRLTVYQIAIASADMLVAAAVLYALFPPVRGGYLTVLEVYLVAFTLTVLSHVPGGWGVLEAIIMTVLRSTHKVPDPDVSMPKVFAAIIVFRVIYFLLPLLCAAAMVGWHEYALGRKWISPVTANPDGRGDRAADQEARNGHAGSRGIGESTRHATPE